MGRVGLILFWIPAYAGMTVRDGNAGNRQGWGRRVGMTVAGRADFGGKAAIFRRYNRWDGIPIIA